MSSLASTEADPIRTTYAAVTSATTRIAGMQSARQLAEEVCADLARRFPDLAADSGGKRRDFNSQLGKLESMSREPNAPVTPVVVAALRSLQAYGNYASHPRTEVSPPEEAFVGAMAAAKLLFNAYRGSAQSLRLREPAPPTPAGADRRDFRRAVGSLPGTPTDGVAGGISGTLAALNGFYRAELECCRSICMLVLAREMEGANFLKLDDSQLIAALDVLSRARPQRVPRKVAIWFSEVRDRWQRVSHFLNELPSQDAAATPESADSSDAAVRLLDEGFYVPSMAKDLFAWFEDSYLKSPRYIPRLGTVVLGVLAVGIGLWALDIAAGEGRRNLKHELRSQLCNEEAPVANDATCERLAEK